MSMRIETIKAQENSWEFFDHTGNLISRHLTAGHMAQQYRDLFNELMRLRDTLEQIGEEVSERRERAANMSDVCPYAETKSEAFCYSRGQREALSGINAKAFDAIKDIPAETQSRFFESYQDSNPGTARTSEE